MICIIKSPDLDLGPCTSFCGASAPGYFLGEPGLHIVTLLVFGRRLSGIEKLGGRQVRKPELV